MRDHLRTHRLCFRLKGIRNAICAWFLLRLLLNNSRVDMFAGDAKITCICGFLWMNHRLSRLVVKSVSSRGCFSSITRSRLYFEIWIFNCLDLMGMKLIWHFRSKEGKRIEEERITNVFGNWNFDRYNYRNKFE